MAPITHATASRQVINRRVQVSRYLRGSIPLLHFAFTRIGQAVVTLGLLLPAVFLMFRLAPGDAADAVVGPNVDPAVADELRARYGLDQPLATQFWLWLKGIMTGDLGMSFQHQAPVSTIVVERLTNTLGLVIPAILVAVLVGVTLGALAGAAGGRTDRALASLSYTVKAAPSFWIATLAVLLFSYKLGLVPSIGMADSSRLGAEEGVARFFSLDFLHHLILPTTILAIYLMVEPMLTTRSGVKEVMGSDFMMLAQAQGSGRATAVMQHGLKNAMLPVVSLAPLMVESMIGGQIIMETIFSWPGMGRAIVDAVNNADYPMMQAVFLFTAAAVIVTNAVVDLAYAYLDPRVRVA
ncbi:MAG: ABC transporter permease [Propionibacteriaceae bacterium]